MKIEISVFAIVVMLILLHTIVTHLFNWWFRKSDDAKVIVGWFTLVEFFVLFKIIHNLLR